MIPVALSREADTAAASLLSRQPAGPQAPIDRGHITAELRERPLVCTRYHAKLAERLSDAG
jgi:hypothetical protein